MPNKIQRAASTRFALFTTIVFFAAAVGLRAGAGDDTAKKATTATTPKPKVVKTIVVKAVPPAAWSTNKVEITGSYIKREVHRNGRVTDGFSPVVVMDSEDIQRTGGADLAGVLRRVPHR